jgi:hypothetical protein
MLRTFFRSTQLAGAAAGFLLLSTIPASALTPATHWDGTPCALAQTDVTHLETVELPAAALRAPAGGIQGPLAPFSIVIRPIPEVDGGTLVSHALALAAFERAADQWEALFNDVGVTVTIDADLEDLGEDNSHVLGSTLPRVFTLPHDGLRQALIIDGASEGDDLILNSLPFSVQFRADLPDATSGVLFSLSGRLGATKPNLKAIGVTGLDDKFGDTDGTIKFNTRFPFDYDNRNGVGSGLVDFETVASHEIGHALGFISIVDGIDRVADEAAGSLGGVQGVPPEEVVVSPLALDLFRFRSGSDGNPATKEDFTFTQRNLVPGVPANFDEVLLPEVPMSTGVAFGDGRQASHWQDDQILGSVIGMMDPSLGLGSVFTISFADMRAFDLMGYDLLIGPTTTTTTSTTSTSTTTTLTTSTTLAPTTTIPFSTTTLGGMCSSTCGDTNGDGKVLAGDALFALRAGVGLVQCETCVCDANDDGLSSAGDAFVILRFAVGIDGATLNCPAF